MSSITLVRAPGFPELRRCASCCLDFGCAGNPFQSALPDVVACSVDSCLCRSDVKPLAMSFLASCVNSKCSNENDVTSYQSFYLGYCAVDHGNPYTTFTDPGIITRPGATVEKTVQRTLEKTIAETVTRVSTAVVTLVPTLATFTSVLTYTTTFANGSVALITSTSATTAAVVTVGPDSTSESSMSRSDKIALGVGLGVGLPALLATCVFGYLQLRYEKRKQYADQMGYERPRSVLRW